MAKLIGQLLLPLMAAGGFLLAIVGLADRRDGLVIAGAVMLGAVLIAGSRKA